MPYLFFNYIYGLRQGLNKLGLRTMKIKCYKNQVPCKL